MLIALDLIYNNFEIITLGLLTTCNMIIDKIKYVNLRLRAWLEDNSIARRCMTRTESDVNVKYVDLGVKTWLVGDSITCW